MIHLLNDYDIPAKPVKILCDNSSAICLLKNSVHHSRAKHIDIKHHFIGDYVLNGNVEIVLINTENQLVDIFTKLLCKERFVILEIP